MALAVVLALVFAVAAVLVAEAGDQTLRITMRHGTPRVQRLERYAPGSVAVTVHAPRADGVTIVGTSPAGEGMRVALARGADGDYDGTLRLVTPGTYSLAVISQLGALRNTTENFALIVERDGARWDVLAALALTALFLGGGIAMILWGVRRRRAAQLT